MCWNVLTVDREVRVKRKKLAIVVGAMVLIVGAGAYIQSRKSSPDEARTLAEAARKDGVLNPSSAAAGMKTETIPQASSKRFEPPPTITTGSYTDPKHRKPSESRN
jgi:hypothetical protein